MRIHSKEQRDSNFKQSSYCSSFSSSCLFMRKRVYYLFFRFNYVKCVNSRGGERERQHVVRGILNICQLTVSCKSSSAYREIYIASVLTSCSHNFVPSSSCARPLLWRCEWHLCKYYCQLGKMLRFIWEKLHFNFMMRHFLQYTAVYDSHKW